MTSSMQANAIPFDAGCCSIRRLKVSDKPELARLANDWEVAKNLRNVFPHPYTDADADAWFGELAKRDPLTNFAIAVDDQFAGGVGLYLRGDVHYRSAEIGCWLGRDYWGRGIATAAVRAFTRNGFAAHDLLRIYAGVFSWNSASMRVLEKVGYAREGLLRQSVVKDGHILDVVMYAMTSEMLTMEKKH